MSPLAPTPIPRGPRAVRTTAEEVSDRIAAILAEPAADLAAEADALARAHAVLREALNDN